MKEVIAIILALSLASVQAVSSQITALDDIPATPPPADTTVIDSELPSYMQPAEYIARPSTPPHSTPTHPSYSGLKYTVLPQNIAIPSKDDLYRSDIPSVSAYGNISSHSGLMTVEQGGLKMGYTIGPFSTEANIFGLHYGCFGGMVTSWGVNATLRLQLTPRWHITAYGTYISPLRGGHAFTPAMAELIATSNFGAYFTYQISDYWGIDIGASATRNPVSGQWRATPNVTPYCKLGKKVKFGIDVGAIAYGIAEQALSNRHSNYNAIAPGAPMPISTPRIAQPNTRR